MTPREYAAKFARVEPTAPDSVLFPKLVGFLKSVREQVANVVGERDAALAREAEMAKDLSLSHHPEINPLMRSLGNSAASSWHRQAVGAGWSEDQLKALTAPFRQADGLPNDVGLSMAAGSTEPLVAYMLQWAATNAPKVMPPVGRAGIQVVPNPNVAASESAAQKPTDERKAMLKNVALGRTDYMPQSA